MDVKNLFQTQQLTQARKPLTPSQSDVRPESNTTEFSDVIDSLDDVEQVIVNTLQGEADSHDLVYSLAETELAVQIAVKVRDKLVEAYQEILRMPV